MAATEETAAQRRRDGSAGESCLRGDGWLAGAREDHHQDLMECSGWP